MGRQSTGTGWGGRVGSVLAVLAVLIAGSLGESPVLVGSAGKSGKKCDPNERFVTDEHGKRYLEARWPLGSKDNLVKLRIPAEYMYWVDLGCSSPFFKDPNIVGPYAGGLYFEMTLPDFQPHNDSNDNLFHGPDWSSIKISIDTLVNFHEKKINIIGQLMKVNQEIFQNPDSSDVKEYNFRYGPKPDRFGLKRFGTITDFSVFNKEYGVPFAADIYYPDHDPIDYYIMCQSEEVKDFKEEPGLGHPTPRCEQHFYSERLDASVELDYRRLSLPQWRVWQEKTEQFLQTIQIIKP